MRFPVLPELVVCLSFSVCREFDSAPRRRDREKTAVLIAALRSPDLRHTTKREGDTSVTVVTSNFFVLWGVEGGRCAVNGRTAVRLIGSASRGRCGPSPSPISAAPKEAAPLTCWELKRHESGGRHRWALSPACRSVQQQTRARRRRLSTLWSRSTLTPPTQGSASRIAPRAERPRDHQPGDVRVHARPAHDPGAGAGGVCGPDGAEGH